MTIQQIRYVMKIAETGSMNRAARMLGVKQPSVSTAIAELEQELGIPFVWSDFKKKDGYHRSIQLSKEYGLYRQDWCGCVYSRRERERQKRAREEA